MRNVMQLLYRTMVTGVFLLLPIAVVVLVLVKVYAVVHPMLLRMAMTMGVASLVGLRLFVIACIIFSCLLAGLLARSKRISNSRDWLERNILHFLPGYQYIRMRMSDQIGQEGVSTDRAVLVQVDDGWSPGMLMERAADGRCVVFMADIPRSTSGAVYIVEAHQVRPLGVPMRELDKCIRRYGQGLLALEARSKPQ